jgi:hypothetical protein
MLFHDWNALLRTINSHRNAMGTASAAWIHEFYTRILGGGWMFHGNSQSQKVILVDISIFPKPKGAKGIEPYALPVVTLHVKEMSAKFTVGNVVYEDRDNTIVIANGYRKFKLIRVFI